MTPFFRRSILCYAALSFLFVFIWPTSDGNADAIHRRSGPDASAGRRLTERVDATAESMPVGTILPVSVPSVSSKKAKAGDKIKARITQEVRLPGGGKIPEGTSVVGHVVSSTRPGSQQAATLVIRFDALILRGKSTPIRTSLRTLASPSEVDEAQVPTSGPGESDVYDWLNTRQIDGDVVYGKGGPVAHGSQIVGESTYHGVFVKPVASADGRCQGDTSGEGPQAFWVFSADACGVYGYANLQIQHAGRTDPVGEIVLESTHGPMQIRSGSGALLRVVGTK